MPRNRLMILVVLVIAAICLLLPQLQMRAVHANPEQSAAPSAKLFTAANYDIRDDES